MLLSNRVDVLPTGAVGTASSYMSVRLTLVHDAERFSSAQLRSVWNARDTNKVLLTDAVLIQELSMGVVPARR